MHPQPGLTQSACGWQAAKLAWELAGSAAAHHPRDPRHFLWQQTQNQQNNHVRHLQFSAKSHNIECRKLAKLFPSFPWDWYFLWLIYCCFDTVKKLLFSRMEVFPHDSKIQRVPVQGFACCRHSLKCCAPAEEELYHGVTSVYFCIPFSVRLCLILFGMKKLHCVCHWHCSCKIHVFPICRAFCAALPERAQREESWGRAR